MNYPIFYHYTAKRFVPSILAHGLTDGAIPMSFSDIRFGFQWITTNANSHEQEWAEGTGRLPYSRTEVRLTVQIPEEKTNKLIKWSTARYLTPLHALLSSYGDPQNWWLFDGRISPKWITQVRDTKLLIASSAKRSGIALPKYPIAGGE